VDAGGAAHLTFGGTLPRVSDLSDAAAVRLQLADYAVADPQNKINVIGGGLTLIGFNPQAGLSLPFALVVWVIVPPKFYDAEAAVEIALEDSGGGLVMVPAPVGPAQPLRIGQAVTFGKPVFAPAYVPAGQMSARAQWVLSFNTGLPLAPGQRYVWRVKIDTETRPDWFEEFYVPGAAPGPVLG
jgi:hypothetical protein